MQINTNGAWTSVECKENKHKTLVAVGITELVFIRAIVVVRIYLVGKIWLKVTKLT